MIRLIPTNIQWDDIIPPENGKIHLNKNGAVLMGLDTYMEIVVANKEVVMPKKWIARWMNKDARDKILDDALLPETLKDEIRKHMEEKEPE